MTRASFRWSADTSRGIIVGVVALAVTSVAYWFLAESTDQPLSLFALPPLLTAVLAGWRPTLVIGSASLAVAGGFGLGEVSAPTLAARLAIIGLVTGAGSLAARFREQQGYDRGELVDSTRLLRAFELSLAPDIESPDGFDVAVRYVAGERHLDMGGDFVDAVALPDGRLAVVIGDVCGHGPREAAFGIALRLSWRTIVLTHRADPLLWVHRLDTMQAGSGSAYVTLCTGIVDRSTAQATLVSAGHPWPVSVSTTVDVVPMRPGTPLGLGPPGWAVTSVDMGEGVLVLYSDGAIENPRTEGASDRWGEAGLLAWLRQRPRGGSATRLADDLIEAVIVERERRDDVALMTIGVRPLRGRRLARRGGGITTRAETPRRSVRQGASAPGELVH